MHPKVLIQMSYLLVESQKLIKLIKLSKYCDFTIKLK